MPNRELSDDETTEISFGRRISAGTGAGTPEAATAAKPAAAFAPDGTLVALLADAGSYAKPVLVFAPDNEKRANGGDRAPSAPGAAPEQQTAQQAEQ
jgi:tRNA pseudouridine55 synthase